MHPHQNTLPMAELYRNRKGFFSINVQAVAGPNLEMLNLVARWPGSGDDARIFDNSRLCAEFENNDINGIILDDAGYPCRPYLMTSLAHPQTPAERRYNGAQIRTRNSIERMFGTWKRIFPCLTMSLRTKLQTILTIIVSTAVLYNFIRRRNDPIDLSIMTNDMPGIDRPNMELGNATRRAIIIQNFS